MPSFHQIASGYTERVKAATVRDEVADDFTKAASSKVNKAVPTRTNLVEDLAKIGTDLAALVYAKDDPLGREVLVQDGQGKPIPLSEVDKDKIADEIARQLGVEPGEPVRRIVKGGSVDAVSRGAKPAPAAVLAPRGPGVSPTRDRNPLATGDLPRTPGTRLDRTNFFMSR